MNNFLFFVSLFILTYFNYINSINWSQLAKDDLKAIHHILLEDSAPGADHEHPEYRSWIEEGYHKALEMTDKVTSHEGYKAAVSYYPAGFQDGHLSVYIDGTDYVDETERTIWYWPGFSVSYIDGKFIVSYVNRSLSNMQVGDEITHIDELTAHEAFVRNVASYKPILLEVEGSVKPYAGLLLIDQSNPFVARPTRCTVLSQGSQSTPLLNWHVLGDADVDKINKYSGTQTNESFFTKEFGAGRGIWIAIPTLDSRDEIAVHELEKLIEEAPSWRNKDIIVLDVRGNSGGSSVWATGILRSLYGTAVFNPIFNSLYQNFSRVLRASEENVRYLRDAAKQHLDADTANQLNAEANIIENALCSENSGLVCCDTENLSAQEEPGVKDSETLHPNTRVYFLTDGYCFSSCLVFAQEARALPQMIHVGQPTGAHTGYGEVRVVKLPSKMANLCFPMAVYRNEPREWNQPFIPKYRFKGDMSNTNALEKWILEIDTFAERR